jgi:hypothetical protein
VGPFEIATISVPDLSTAYKKIAARYFERENYPVTQITIIKTKGSEILADAPESLIEDLHSLQQALTFSHLSQRVFFHPGKPYCNTSHFEMYMHRTHEAGVVLQSRRRDGSTGAYLPLDFYAMYCPLQVASTDPLSPNVELANALFALIQHPESEGFVSAIDSFIDANTDSPQISERHESIHLYAAFERLFNIGNSDHKKCAKKLIELLNIDAKPTDHYRHLTNRKRDDKLQQENTKGVWIKDLAIVRGQYAHGNNGAPPTCWSLREHLLLGAFIFPLAIKAHLARSAEYNLTDEDKAYINLFDELCDLKNLFEKHVAKYGSEIFAWAELVKKAQLPIWAKILYATKNTNQSSESQ